MLSPHHFRLTIWASSHHHLAWSPVIPCHPCNILSFLTNPTSPVTLSSGHHVTLNSSAHIILCGYLIPHYFSSMTQSITYSLLTVDNPSSFVHPSVPPGQPVSSWRHHGLGVPVPSGRPWHDAGTVPGNQQQTASCLGGHTAQEHHNQGRSQGGTRHSSCLWHTPVDTVKPARPGTCAPCSQ